MNTENEQDFLSKLENWLAKHHLLCSRQVLKSFIGHNTSSGSQRGRCSTMATYAVVSGI